MAINNIAGVFKYIRDCVVTKRAANRIFLYHQKMHAGLITGGKTT